ncbi:mucin-2-like [Wyeomyia smithii]|uniref:mucin-2-like n=1 Tax=Wyeomyia smithii TaxID=174621 RepID=UPI002467F443|nr:mucin-2-like [Wyeomyia smithii]
MTADDDDVFMWCREKKSAEFGFHFALAAFTNEYILFTDCHQHKCKKAFIETTTFSTTTLSSTTTEEQDTITTSTILPTISNFFVESSTLNPTTQSSTTVEELGTVTISKIIPTTKRILVESTTLSPSTRSTATTEELDTVTISKIIPAIRNIFVESTTPNPTNQSSTTTEEQDTVTISKIIPATRRIFIVSTTLSPTTQSTTTTEELDTVTISKIIPTITTLSPTTVAIKTSAPIVVNYQMLSTPAKVKKKKQFSATWAPWYPGIRVPKLHCGSSTSFKPNIPKKKESILPERRTPTTKSSKPKTLVRSKLEEFTTARSTPTTTEATVWSTSTIPLLTSNASNSEYVDFQHKDNIFQFEYFVPTVNRSDAEKTPSILQTTNKQKIQTTLPARIATQPYNTKSWSNLQIVRTKPVNYMPVTPLDRGSLRFSLELPTDAEDLPKRPNAFTIPEIEKTFTTEKQDSPTNVISGRTISSSSSYCCLLVIVAMITSA